MNSSLVLRAASVGFAMAAMGSNASAADGWKVRFPISGTLGGEIVAPIQSGVFGSMVLTQVDVDRVTGGDGNPLTLKLPGTSIDAKLDVKQTQSVYNILLGYTTETQYAGGRLTMAINIPYMDLDRKGVLTAADPALQTALQGPLAAYSKKISGTAAGLGDVEVTGAWAYSEDNIKVVTGVSLAMPTAKYDKDSALNLGYGNYYTLRPGAAVAYKTGNAMTLGARVSLGLNSANTDNGIRTGNFAALDLAGALMTPIGVVGPHLTHVSQYEDDQGGPAYLGGNRFSATGVGFFYTTLIRPISAGLNIAYMKMFESRNALSGSFLQFRLTKAF